MQYRVLLLVKEEVTAQQLVHNLLGWQGRPAIALVTLQLSSHAARDNGVSRRHFNWGVNLIV